MMERNSQDEFLKLWDTVHDLQELSNTTSRNLEDIYDKDIHKLQQFENIALEEIKRIKADINDILTGAVSSTSRNTDHSYEEKFYQLQDSIQMIRNSNKINQNLFQSFRSDLNRAYVDIDDIKKFRQTTLAELQMLGRLVGRIEVDLIEETIAKVGQMEIKVNNLESSLSKATQRLRKLNRNTEEGDDEKVDLLLKEIQNMKTQMFFLQQSILQMRTQEQISLEVSGNEVGPAYNDEMTAELGFIRTELQTLSERVSIMENRMVPDNMVKRNEFDIRNNAIIERIDDVEHKADNARIVADACDVAGDSVRRDLDNLNKLLAEVSLFSKSNC